MSLTSEEQQALVDFRNEAGVNLIKSVNWDRRRFIRRNLIGYTRPRHLEPLTKHPFIARHFGGYDREECCHTQRDKIIRAIKALRRGDYRSHKATLLLGLWHALGAELIMCGALVKDVPERTFEFSKPSPALVSARAKLKLLEQRKDFYYGKREPVDWNNPAGSQMRSPGYRQREDAR